MKLIKLQNINKKDIPLHYRNEFSCDALFSSSMNSGGAEVEHPVEFAVERSALGKIDINVTIKGDLDYPLIPVIKTLKLYIIEMDRQGLLP